MKSKSLQKPLALLLALGMLISSLPITANAQAPITQGGNILESDPRAGAGDFLTLGDPLPSDYQPLDADDINLILDDGTGESSMGTSGGEVSIIALNRFSPEGQFPFLLTEISFLANNGSGSVMAPGEPIRLVVFQNTNGEAVSDPSDGAELLLEVNETVKVATGWNVYELDEPLRLDGPGDVLIGVLSEHRPGTPYRPAVYDTNTNSHRSWIGIWTDPSPVPSPVTIPFPTTGTGTWGGLSELGFPGTFTLRGKGFPAVDYKINGTVTNASGAPVVGATIAFTPGVHTAKTNASGFYRTMLDSGEYSATVSGFG